MTTAKAAAHHTTSHSLKLADIFDPAFITYFVAGGAAGAASRTVVSPLERLKIIQQVQQKTSGTRYDGVMTSLIRMWKEEPYGRGWFRGNGINCVRIVPYSAVQFCTYEKLKQMFTHDHALDTPRRLAAGALAGITSVCSTYPLDLVRSRLSLATAAISQSSTSSSLYTAHEMTMWGMTMKVFREEGGLRGLYRGVISTAVGVAPYVGCNFAVYGALRDVVTPPDKTTVPRKLLCGALAGSISQTITYPFDVVRRKMQVVGMKSDVYGPKYTSGIGAVIGIFKAEGMRGLYRGISANLLKVAPSISTSFFVYEWVRDTLQDDHD